MLGNRSWAELPPELIIRVLAELDLGSLTACKRVCHFFHNLIEDSTELQYKIELCVAGMDDGSSKTLSVASRLERLRAHQQAWAELKWAEEIWVPIALSGTWELYGGVWAARAWDTKELAFMQYPSLFRDIPMKQWVIDDMGFAIRDFSLDISQDLLVLVELPTPDSRGDFPPCRIHLRTLSTGEPHPLARSPLLLHKPYLFDSAWTYSIIIMDRHLGIMFRCPEGEQGPEHELVIWNWQSSSVKMTRPGIEMESFAFLTSKLVVITLFTFRQERPGLMCLKPVLCITDFTKYSTTYRCAAGSHACQLGLPELTPGVFPSNMKIRADPAPSFSPNQDVPFHIGSANRVFVVTFTAASRRVHAPVTMFIPLQTMLNFYAQGRREVPWEEWGREGTRILGALRTSPHWLCYIYGPKFVHRSVPEEIEVYDFNILALRRMQAASDVPENVKIITEPSTFEHSAVFNEEITTSAPYMVTTARLPERLAEDPFCTPMLTEDNLFFITRREDSLRRCCLLTF
ncbi:hypothetical protein NEOLEDRAFT_1128037 [Neolentinus lepideus HHB14362 ss-1]|uniref:F-box domain-containing protein n=1 Tax=Neolentinus lepideus HHB14362 ss-1 TaxID=1314782 RepID=A0A165V8E7_9AGAM|nr:hypothetical protein NEOLEDRAFT_1128037 [Neolentinus lepideus HHB14362 ss-1]